MIITFILVVIAIVAATIFAIAARGQGAAVTDISELVGRTRPVDLLAFRNLVDPEEEEYLRATLPAEEFRIIQRERLKAAIEYVGCVAENAAVLLRLGETAGRSEDPQVADAGRELVDNALRLRIYALLAETKLYVGILLPGIKFSPARISDSYEHLTGMVSRLSRLQHYGQTHRVVATL